MENEKISHKKRGGQFFFSNLIQSKKNYSFIRVIYGQRWPKINWKKNSNVLEDILSSFALEKIILFYLQLFLYDSSI